MSYALIRDGAVVHSNMNLQLLKSEFPNTGFPKNALANADIRAAYNIVEVAAVAKPESETHNVTEGTPTLVDGVWTQTWEQTAKTNDELTAEAVAKRIAEYGSTEVQLEYIMENGVSAFQTRQQAIKDKYPKP
ncbi:MAG: hypothetical protein QF704_09735 [Anaerolineales bacterium]|jgi:hypothetical protein|nr:hypothetical protein [Anaerolineales bacterium]